MSDLVGFKRTFVPLTILQAVTMLSYQYLAKSRITFCMATVVMLFCMGGNFALFPAQVLIAGWGAWAPHASRPP
eukprot:scaffold5991_cov102-Isochrysis_galbana.AAC.1